MSEQKMDLPVDAQDLERIQTLIYADGHEPSPRREELYAWKAFQRGLSELINDLEARDEDDLEEIQETRIWSGS